MGQGEGLGDSEMGPFWKDVIDGLNSLFPSTNEGDAELRNTC